MQITDEIVEAALRGWNQFSALDAEENKDSSEIPDVKAFMRGALEAALEARVQDSCCQEDGWACGPFMDQERCIEDLAPALPSKSGG